MHCTITGRRQEPIGYGLWHLQSPFKNGRLEYQAAPVLILTYEVMKAALSSVRMRLCISGEL